MYANEPLCVGAYNHCGILLVLCARTTLFFVDMSRSLIIIYTILFEKSVSVPQVGNFSFHVDTCLFFFL